MDTRPYRARAEMYALSPDGRLLSGLYDEDRTLGVFGGGVDDGEDVAQAAAREMLEESGYSINNPRVLPVAPHTVEWGPVEETDSPQKKERKKYYRGSQTHFATGELGPLSATGALEPSSLQRIKLRRLSAALRMLSERRLQKAQHPELALKRKEVLRYLQSMLQNKEAVDKKFNLAQQPQGTGLRKESSIGNAPEEETKKKRPSILQKILNGMKLTAGATGAYVGSQLPNAAVYLPLKGVPSDHQLAQEAVVRQKLVENHPRTKYRYDYWVPVPAYHPRDKRVLVPISRKEYNRSTQPDRIGDPVEPQHRLTNFEHAHELGHSRSLLSNPAMAVASKLGIVGGGLASLANIFVRDKERGRKLAITGAGLGLPIVALELEASLRGSAALAKAYRDAGKKIPLLTRLGPFASLPSYLTLAAAPLFQHWLKDRFGFYRAENDEKNEKQKKDNDEPAQKKASASRKFYHGTYPDRIEQILAEGLDPAYVGSGGGTLPGLEEKDPGKKLFITQYPEYAKWYADMAAKTYAQRKAREEGKNWLRVLLASHKPAPVIEIDLPENVPVTRLGGGFRGDEYYVKQRILPQYLKALVAGNTKAAETQFSNQAQRAQKLYEKINWGYKKPSKS